MKSIVYIMHTSEQIDLWFQHLPSENIELINVSPDNDIVELLEQTPNDDLPSLIMVGMSIQSPGSNLLQASKVSRWCKDNQPSIKIIFLTARHEFELTKLEQRWAVKQGAVCILPRLDRENLYDQVRKVYEHLNFELPIEAPPEIPEIPETPLPSPKITSQQSGGSNDLLTQKKDLITAVSQLKQVIQNNKESIDTYPLSDKIYTHFMDLEQVIQDYIEVITIESQRQKLRSLGDRFAQVNRNANKSTFNPADSNNNRKSALLDFIQE